jgi:glycosyltransferase involved in cell wall biosynthesis
MKVLFISNSYPTPKNPTNQVFVRNMRNEMEEQGVETDLIYNIAYYYLPNALSKKNFFYTLLKFLGLLLSVLLNIKKFFKNDIVFAHAIIFPTFYSVLLKPIHKKRVVCFVHGGDLNANINKRNIQNKLIKYSLSKSDLIIANSKDIFQKLNNLLNGKDNIHLIYPGVDLRLMKYLNSKDELKQRYKLQDRFVLLSIGNAIKRKGFDVLIKALAILQKEKPEIPVHLLLITQGEELENYNDLISLYHLTESVDIISKVEQRELVKYYNLADLYIMPSREEPLGLVAIEAMACGTPVLGSAVGGLKEVLADNSGFLFENENIQDLKDKIISIYNNKFDQKELMKNMNKKTKEYCLNHNMKQLIRLMFPNKD